jgi:hypothetical protein
MASRRPGRLRSAFGAAFMGLLAVGMTSFAPPTAHRGSGRPTPAHAVDSVVVRRMDLDTTLLAGGDLMPSKQTTVTCEVEDVDRGPNRADPGDRQGRPARVPGGFGTSANERV